VTDSIKEPETIDIDSVPENHVPSFQSSEQIARLSSMMKAYRDEPQADNAPKPKRKRKKPVPKP